MKDEDISTIVEELVYRRMKIAGVELPEDMQKALEAAAADEHVSPHGSIILHAILENLTIARRTRLPMCQDTGMVLVFLDIGERLNICLGKLKDAISRGIEKAYKDGSFRKSVVEEPVFDRVNTGNNLPAVFHIEIVPGNNIGVHLLLKGFGSENCSGLRMLNPTAGEEGVIDAVVDIMRKAGGKPCPPVVIGVGIGGTADRAAVLSKRALLRKVGSHHTDPRYAAVEQKILDRVQTLDIGPGGLGGVPTALGVLLEHDATHIAGLPVAVSISCWADRKMHLILDAEGREI